MRASCRHGMSQCDVSSVHTVLCDLWDEEIYSHRGNKGQNAKREECSFAHISFLFLSEKQIQRNKIEKKRKFFLLQRIINILKFFLSFFFFSVWILYLSFVLFSLSPSYSDFRCLFLVGCGRRHRWVELSKFDAMLQSTNIEKMWRKYFDNIATWERTNGWTKQTG